MQRTHLLACALLLIGPPASASEIGHWYVTPQVGVVSPDELRELEDDDRLVGLSVGKHASARWSGELTFNTTELDGPNLSAVDLETASFDTLRVFRREKVVAPYLTVGMGATRAHSAALPSDTGFMAQAGVGLPRTRVAERCGHAFLRLSVGGEGTLGRFGQFRLLPGLSSHVEPSVLVRSSPRRRACFRAAPLPSANSCFGGRAGCNGRSDADRRAGFVG